MDKQVYIDFVNNYSTNVNPDVSIHWFHNLSHPFIKFNMLKYCSIDELLDVIVAALVSRFGSNYSLFELYYDSQKPYTGVMSELCSTRESFINVIYEMKLVFNNARKVTHNVISLNAARNHFVNVDNGLVSFANGIKHHLNKLNEIFDLLTVLIDQCNEITKLLKGQRYEEFMPGLGVYEYSYDYKSCIDQACELIVMPFMDLYSDIEQYKQSLSNRE